LVQSVAVKSVSKRVILLFRKTLARNRARSQKEDDEEKPGSPVPKSWQMELSPKVAPQMWSGTPLI